MIGTSLGPYEILEPLGKGGMGEVYLAEDTRLDRKVALKVLPPELAADPERRARFEREAKAVAALNHPNIVVLHSVEQAHEPHERTEPDERTEPAEASKPLHFITMELVEGKPLSELIPRDGLSPERFFELAIQLADALAAAHERGIVHRDLKPTNVMVTPEGRVKVLDFGLARLRPESDSAGETGTEAATAHATGAQELTGEGRILGTAAYMSPEQAEGRPVDHRTDLFSLGVLLYEMATGERPFQGETRVSIISSILKDTPRPVTELDPELPRHLSRIVKLALEKDPERRFQSAKDVRNQLSALKDELDSGEALAPADIPADGRIPWQPWAVGAALLAALAALLWAWVIGSGAESGPLGTTGAPTVFELAVPELDWNAVETGMAVSPAGDAIAYMGEPAPGRPPVLWLREFADPEPRRVEGTEDAANPFWSPDGRHVGYVKDGAIRFKDRGGGPERTITEIGKSTFGPPSWAPDGTILFQVYDPGLRAEGAGALWRVPVDGDDREEATNPADGMSHVYPYFLPDGRRFLYAALGEDAERVGLYVGSLDGDEPRRIEGVRSRAEYAAGHLFYSDQGALVARPFDPGDATFTGDPVTVGQIPGAFFSVTGMAEFSVSLNGTALAYGSAVRSHELGWFTAGGEDLGRLGEPGPYEGFRISPAGDQVAVEVEDLSTGTDDVWIFDVQRNVAARSFGTRSNESDPVWSPRGRRIAYASDREGPPRVYIRRVDGSGESRLVPTERIDYTPLDWSRDGRYLALRHWSQGWNRDIHLVPVDGDGSATVLAGGPGAQVDARFSPDSRWVAFSSDEPGRMEIFAVPVSSAGDPERVSNSGGRRPVWHPDGDELYYVNGATVYAVPFSLDTGEIGLARELFSVDARGGIAGIDIAPDGERFLIAVGDPADSGASITIVLNWLAGGE